MPEPRAHGAPAGSAATTRPARPAKKEACSTRCTSGLLERRLVHHRDVPEVHGPQPQEEPRPAGWANGPSARSTDCSRRVAGRMITRERPAAAAAARCRRAGRAGACAPRRGSARPARRSGVTSATRARQQAAAERERLQRPRAGGPPASLRARRKRITYTAPRARMGDQHDGSASHSSCGWVFSTRTRLSHRVRAAYAAPATLAGHARARSAQPRRCAGPAARRPAGSAVPLLPARLRWSEPAVEALGGRPGLGALALDGPGPARWWAASSSAARAVSPGHWWPLIAAGARRRLPRGALVPVPLRAGPPAPARLQPGGAAGAGAVGRTGPAGGRRARAPRRGARQLGRGRAPAWRAAPAFRVRRLAPPRALLVDDVMTTGATLAACARRAPAAGAVGVAAVLCTYPGR